MNKETLQTIKDIYNVPVKLLKMLVKLSQQNAKTYGGLLNKLIMLPFLLYS